MALKVRFGDAAHGWMPVSIEMGEQHLRFVASSVPYASLNELVSGLITLLNPRASTVVRWSTEPIEYDFTFRVHDDLVALEVVEFPDYRRSHRTGHIVFVASDTRPRIVLPFWRALRDLEARASFEQQWGTAISERDMRLLEQLLDVA